MDYLALPPEINSGRMYAGPGSGSMLTAAAAWRGLAGELQATASSYQSVISGLIATWLGPSSATMVAAAAPYVTWLSATAAQADQAAAQATMAAAAYQTAFAETVPPPVIAANRAQLMALIATNLFGQNTPAIMATEAQYMDMWAQDAAAMYGYAGASATATQLTPFSAPPQTTQPGGAAGQSAAVSQLMSATPQALRTLGLPAAAAPATDPPSPISSLTTFLSNLNSSPLARIAANVEFVTKGLRPFNDTALSIALGLVVAARTINDTAVGLEGPLFAQLASGSVGPATVAPAVSAGFGNAGTVGALSVPPSWAAATPTIRLAATALQGTSATVTVAAADGAGSLYGQMALAGLAGGVLGATVPRAGARTAARAGGDAPPDKNSKAPDKLKRVLAELSQQPESVQHWHTDKAHLEGLLDQLSKKPGVHAVHLSNKPKPPPSKVPWG
ncbi:hypothetical protein A5672_12790 [Mycobacterium alsense]|uniref:PPE family protein n=1 Tax=Mycobacterium alsense TaxID=324058 RepID=A0ABD6P346_9MYCO|nr:PPE family protein [Mycobacterium alsense]OBG41135.1 hypothetical protein A5672_12790 [Mycobacterium alsense]OBJ01307.1 hypothetical protein A5660_24230 [Mycobacterium alsense]